MTRRAAGALAAVALAWTAPRPVRAQGYDANLLKPGLGGRTLLVTTASETLGPWAVRGEALSDLAMNPLRITRGGVEGVAVGRALYTHVTVRLGLPYGAEAALAAPAQAHVLGRNPELPPERNGLSPALGDVRAALRYRALEREWGALFAAPFVVLPTGSPDDLTGGAGVSGGLLAGVDGGSPLGGLHWAANAAWWERSRAPRAGAERGRQLRVSAGADYGLVRRLDVALRAGAEVLGIVAMAPDGGPYDTPAEALASVVADLGACAVRFGMGAGIVKGIGASSTRLLLGLSCGAQPTNDRDGDGLRDADDRCPDRAEDRDGFEDADGCPDVDNDQDGLFDRLDRCPNARQADGRTDGCPTPDKDGDGIEGRADRCPDKAEDKDGFEDADGCPDPDNDGDGAPDTTDECPGELEDADGWADDDGCPDPDNDADGFPDGADECPNEPETWNASLDRDGCADGEGLLVVRDGRIALAHPLAFKDRGRKSKIAKAGMPVVEALASLLRARGDLGKVLIIARARKEPKAAQRAAALRLRLMDLGVPGGRLDARGEAGEADELELRIVQ